MQRVGIAQIPEPLSYCLNYQSVFIQTPRSTLINLTLKNYSNNYYAFKEIGVLEPIIVKNLEKYFNIEELTLTYSKLLTPNSDL